MVKQGLLEKNSDGRSLEFIIGPSTSNMWIPPNILIMAIFFLFCDGESTCDPDAKWHSREDVKKALTFAEYKKAQRTAAGKVDQMCKGVERGQSLSSDFNVESGELAPMFIPGPFAIAHHLISSWVNGDEAQIKQLASSFSNL